MSKPQPKNGNLGNGFQRLSSRCSQLVGTKWAFSAALATIVVWAIVGPHFHYSDTWQLVINTATTIVTFLMVFLIQNTQNRDARAIHLKLDEIIRAVHSARNEMINVESLSDEELQLLANKYEKLRDEWEERKSQKSAA